ncbi:MAG: LysR family transcriptional regulator [Ruthenibacterium lactatiformans]
MFDAKIETLLEVISAGSYTRAAQRLSLTQPAVSHHMRQLEQEFGIHIFYKDKKELRLTPEGEILVKYARRALAVYRNARQAIEDSRICMSHIGVGITHTVGESCVPQVLAEYCNQTPGVHINIVTDTIKNLYDMMRSYELDVAIVDGQFPASGYTEVLLDTDYLCLVVSPIHPLARRASVAIGALQGERFIMRPKGAGTRSMFESYLSECGADIRDFNIIIEMDSVATIKGLSRDLGISVAQRLPRDSGPPGSRPLEKPGMVRRIIWCIIRIFPIRRSWRSCAVYISAGAEPGEARKKAKK